MSDGCALVSGSSFPKKELLELGSRWQLSPSRPGSTGTSPSRAARSRPALRPGQFITPVPPGMAGHGAATSLTAHPSAPQTLGTRGSSAPSPAPRQGAMSPAHTIVTPHVIYSAEVPLGSPPCPASIPLMGTVAVENSGSGGMQPHMGVLAMSHPVPWGQAMVAFARLRGPRPPGQEAAARGTHTAPTQREEEAAGAQCGVGGGGRGWCCGHQGATGLTGPQALGMVAAGRVRQGSQQGCSPLAILNSSMPCPTPSPCTAPW